LFSDLERAFETATLIHQNNSNISKQGTKINEIKQNKLLRERDFGIYNLMSKEERDQAAVDLDAENFRPEGGESDEDVCKRVKRFIDDLLNSNDTNNEKSNSISEKHQSYSFLIATHGGWIMRFIRLMSQFTITDPNSHCEEVKDYGSLLSGKSIANTAIFIFDLVLDGENCEIISYNCTKCNSFKHLNCLE